MKSLNKFILAAGICLIFQAVSQAVEGTCPMCFSFGQTFDPRGPADVYYDPPKLICDQDGAKKKCLTEVDPTVIKVTRILTEGGQKLDPTTEYNKQCYYDGETTCGG